MATDELDVPRNYGFARIGSAMNYVTRELHALKYAFDMAQLNQLGMIKPTPNVTSTQTVQSRAYSTSSQKDSSISRTSGLSIRTPMTRVGLEHHTSTSNSHLDTTKGMSLTIAMAFRNYELRLADDEEKLYRCASDDFRAAIEKLSAAEGEAWLRAYEEFTKEWGHGFVSGLKLICCAAGELQMSYSSEASREQQRHGRSISAARPSGGAALASDWLKEQASSASDGTLSTRVQALPAISPCATWASDLMDTYTKLALAEIAKAPPTIPDKPATELKAPEIPSFEPPSKSKLPPVTLTTPEDMVKYMQLAQMEADGVDVTTTDWETYQKQIQEDQKNLKKNDIAKANEADDKAVKTDSTLSDAPPDAAAGPINDVDFGDYAIYDIEVTTYREAFKTKLKWPFHTAPSRTGLNLARIHTFLLTRQLIGSYIRFLSSLPQWVTGGYTSGSFAKHFEDVLTSCSEWVSNKQVITDGTYQEVRDRFKNELFAEGTSQNGLDVYHCFVEHFAILSNAPYGFLMTATDTNNIIYYAELGSWYLGSTSGIVYFTSIPALNQWYYAMETSELAKRSYRVLPVIVGGATPGIRLAIYVPSKTPDGQWCFLDANGKILTSRSNTAWTLSKGSAGSGLGAKSGDFELSVDNSVLSRNFNERKAGQTRLPITLTPIGFENTQEGTVPGIPMWYQQPFELVKESVLNGFQ